MNTINKLSISLALLALSPLASASTPLVDVNWVKANSCNKDVRVLDIRNDLDGGSKISYMQGHIPCAVHTDYLKGGWRTLVNKVPGQLPPTDKIEKLIGSLGIDNKTHVVIYHAGKNSLDMGSATRVYWTFKVLGHDNVSILDGGLAAYTSDKKNKLEKGNKTPQALAFKAHLNSAMIATKEDVMKAKSQGIELVDNRPANQYVGVNRHPKSTRNGTFPGAVNLPENWLTKNGGGAFRDVETLGKLYSQAHVDAQKESINFCNTGHWASLGWFATSELMGNKNVKLYDGSMVEWTADPSLPMVSAIKF